MRLCRSLPMILFVLGCLLSAHIHTVYVCECVCSESHWLYIDEAGAVIYSCWSRGNNVFIWGGQRSRPHSANITPYGLDQLHTGQSTHFTLLHCMLQTHTNSQSPKWTLKLNRQKVPTLNLFFFLSQDQKNILICEAYSYDPVLLFCFTVSFYPPCCDLIELLDTDHLFT